MTTPRSLVMSVASVTLCWCSATLPGDPSRSVVRQTGLAGFAAASRGTTAADGKPEYPGRNFRAALDQGVAHFKAATENDPTDAAQQAALAQAEARAEDQPHDRVILQNPSAKERQRNFPPVQIAYLHIGQGEVDAASDRLGQDSSYREDSGKLTLMKVGP